ncbi:hypothetical protein JYU29_05080 [Tianweitania sp. BSSL-BM11]|uniref:Uncharacterized protein n=1 Tax=Tianweitania aestuarii TaxID=2814886 RepID=A0ABS5RSN0_9HYPH|nr:hypothetical protein [Tianweitania aestuarii]MBS9720060.1 hypothetical protein [Tianweitania aestuarii]
MAEIQTTRELARQAAIFEKLRRDYFALYLSVSPLALEAARKAQVAA